MTSLSLLYLAHGVDTLVQLANYNTDGLDGLLSRASVYIEVSSLKRALDDFPSPTYFVGSLLYECTPTLLFRDELQILSDIVASYPSVRVFYVCQAAMRKHREIIETRFSIPTLPPGSLSSYI